jgi:uncharacterized membrane protein HdeD (DUF308 family)
MDINTRVQPFIRHRILFLVRGLLLSIFGFSVFILSIANPEFRIMSTTGWLPVIAFVLILSGILESVDSYAARESPIFLIYTNLAIVDLVTGIIILFELHNNPQRLVLLATSFLFIKGSFRIFAALHTRPPNFKGLILTGFFSLLLGVIHWRGMPANGIVAFMSTCLALELTIRGIVLVSFSLWLRKLNKCQVSR